MAEAGAYSWDGKDLILQIRVQPRASHDQWLEPPAGGQFRVRITAPPVDGQANTQLRAFLATVFGVAKSQVTLLAGETSRNKRWRIATPRHLPPGIKLPTA